MARIKIKDLPKDQKITKEEMKKVVGGIMLHRNTSTTGFEDPLTAKSISLGVSSKLTKDLLGMGNFDV